jgi:hypothetical protein
VKALVRPITRADIKGPALYGPIRDDFRRRVIELKRPRRVVVGDRVALVFDNRITLQLHVEEILRAESVTTEAGIADEIAVQNQLMPTPDSLAATLFVELADNTDAVAGLNELVGLDEHVVLHVGSHAIRAQFEPGRATGERISAVQYTRFPLSPEAKAALLTEGTELAIEIDHPKYRHRVVCSPALRESLAGDYA